jgi:hypothetical protein
MLRVIKVFGGITIGAIGITAVVALGAVTARFVNKVVRECMQPFVPKAHSMLIPKRNPKVEEPKKETNSQQVSGLPEDKTA